MHCIRRCKSGPENDVSLWHTQESHLHANSSWQEAFEAFSDSEQRCIRNELGDELLGSVLGLRVAEEGDTEQWQVGIVECLDSETASALLLSIITAGLADEGE